MTISANSNQVLTLSEKIVRIFVPAKFTCDICGNKYHRMDGLRIHKGFAHKK